jgi:superfamily I DNA and/or RNA helicase
LSLTEELIELQKNLYDKSSRNPLLNIKRNQLWIENFNDNKSLSKVYKQQQFFKKEYGLETTLFVTHFIKWKHPIKNRFYTSPLIYSPILITRNQRIDLIYNYDCTDNFYQINPILKHEFSTLFNLNVELIEQSIESFVAELKLKFEENGGQISTCNEFDDSEQWQIIRSNVVGSFNYKKSILSYDYNQIIKEPNNSIKSILNHTTNAVGKVIPLELNQSDISQKTAIEFAINNNSVIQGPPGTGKSHTIVELIKQNLLEGKKVLFVSEKQSALEVVRKKLEDDKLNWLIGNFNSDKKPKKSFYKNLKKTLFKLDNFEPKSKASKVIDSSKEELFFKTYIDKINQPFAENQPSILELQTYLAKQQVKDLEFNSKSKIPTYKTWQKFKSNLTEVEQVIQENFEIEHLSNLPFIHFNKAIFAENHTAEKINKRVDEFLNNIELIAQTTKKFNLNWDWKSIEMHCIASSILNIANKSQLEILDPKSKAYNSFNIWSKKYELTKNKLELSSAYIANWTKLPELKSIDSHIDYLNNKPSKFKLFKSKTDILFKQNKDKLISNEAKIEALNQVKNNYILQNALNEIKLKLKHNLNIHEPEVEIQQLNNLRLKLDSLNNNEYINLLEHELSLDLINSLHNLQPKIQAINQTIRFIFNDFYPKHLNEIQLKLKQTVKVLPKFKRFLNEIKTLVSLPNEMLSFIRANENSVESLTGIVAYHNLLELTRYNSVLNKFDSSDILPNFHKLSTAKAKQNRKQIETIQNSIQQKWDNYNKLISLPLSKLSDNEKLKRKEFKSAKRIIYHESAKQQQHLPIKSLIESTNNVILDLTPVWLINPLSISESLPCSSEVFDVVIFDEASQIPLEDALPAIYRAKKVVVVGDSKQMPPTTFFSSQTDGFTLLQQAESVFKSNLLKWHYRSEHPALMAFSNHHFYNNELSYFPETTAQSPITFHKIQGQYIDGKNSVEAKAVALKYKELLDSGHTNVGIIAFSKSQETEINKQIKKLNLIENELLEVRNLENTQGIEKEIVIISIGYGPDENGDFNMNFGPINQNYGANRLNVLVTRAQKQMLVFSSVESKDFKLSENKGVQLLTDFIRYSENNNTIKLESPETFIFQVAQDIIDKRKNNIVFKKAINGVAVNCFIDFEANKILLLDPCLHENENTDIFTLLSIVSKRFKTIKVLLTQDYWQDKTNFEAQIERYFN